MKTLRDESGFTLIEAIIVCAVVAILLAAGLSQVGMTRKNQSQAEHRLRARQLVEMELSRLKGASAAYPPILDDNGKSLSYVRCFSRSGAPAKNRRGTQGYQALELENPMVPADDLCEGTEFEVHITPSADKPNEAVVDAFVLLGGARAKVSYHVPVSFEPGV